VSRKEGGSTLPVTTKVFEQAFSIFRSNRFFPVCEFLIYESVMFYDPGLVSLHLAKTSTSLRCVKILMKTSGVKYRRSKYTLCNYKSFDIAFSIFCSYIFLPYYYEFLIYESVMFYDPGFCKNIHHYAQHENPIENKRCQVQKEKVHFR
jgi:hypothetical protein